MPSSKATAWRGCKDRRPSWTQQYRFSAAMARIYERNAHVGSRRNCLEKTASPVGDHSSLSNGVLFANVVYLGRHVNLAPAFIAMTHLTVRRRRQLWSQVFGRWSELRQQLFSLDLVGNHLVGVRGIHRPIAIAFLFPSNGHNGIAWCGATFEFSAVFALGATHPACFRNQVPLGIFCASCHGAPFRSIELRTRSESLNLVKWVAVRSISIASEWLMYRLKCNP